MSTGTTAHRSVTDTTSNSAAVNTKRNSARLHQMLGCPLSETVYCEDADWEIKAVDRRNIGNTRYYRYLSTSKPVLVFVRVEYSVNEVCMEKDTTKMLKNTSRSIALIFQFCLILYMQNTCKYFYKPLCPVLHIWAN